MRTRYLTIFLTIVGFCLFHFASEAADPETKSTDLASTATNLTVNSATKNPEKGQSNNFSRGSQKWQTYASAAAGDQGKGEMYALHIGYGYFFRDYLSVNVDVLGAYIRSGIDDNGVAAGLDVTFRRHFSWVNDDLWSAYLDIGGGLQQQSLNLPATGTLTSG